MRNRLSFSYSRTSQHFTENEDILPPSLVRTLSQINPIHATQSYSRSSILISSIYLRLGLPNGLFPSGFPTNIYTHSSSPTCVPHVLTISPSLTWSFWLYLPKSISYEVMQFSQAYYHFIPFRSKRQFWLKSENIYDLVLLMYFHVIEWLYTGFGLVIGFIELLQICD
jgi:hypothetical protein